MDHNHKTTIYSEAASIELGKSPKDLHESRANVFAAAFLMPEDGLKQVLSRYHISSQRDMSAYVVDFLRQYYSVSYEAMLWRLLSLQMVSTAQREALWNTRPKAHENTQAVNVEPLLPPRYRTLALEAYRNAKISIGKLADFLKQDIYETRKMVKDLALVQLEQ
jgi:Zn-dependent peptidase ImmA (M78 family)